MAAMEPRTGGVGAPAVPDEGASPRGRFGSALIDASGRVLETDGVWDRSIGIAIGQRVHDAVLPEDLPELERALADTDERLAAVVRTGSQGGALVSLLLLEGVHRDGVWYTIGMRSFQPRAAIDGVAAACDPITGLLDRAGFTLSLESALARCAQGDTAALLLLDLDGFKSVNDTYGHAVGDRLLATIGEAVRSVLREGDDAGRFGGDEFAVVLRRTTQIAARAAAERILSAVSRARPSDLGMLAATHASAGLVVLRPGDGISAEEALTRADLALYEAKSDARSRVVEYPAADPEAATRMRVRLSWGQRLHRALEGDRFELHAQPVIDLRTGALAGYELLLHLHDGDEPIPADGFMEQALRAGLAERLDQWLLVRATEVAVRFRNALHGAPVAISVSGHVLADRSLAARLQNEFTRSGVEPGRIILEVRDGGAVEDRALAIDTAQALRRLGVGLALDEFGTSRGTLELLRELPFSRIKVDPPFTGAATANAFDDAVIRYAAELGSQFGIDVVGAGLESPMDVDRARELGVALGQGGLFGAPLPLADALARAQPAAPGA